VSEGNQRVYPEQSDRSSLVVQLAQRLAVASDVRAACTSALESVVAVLPGAVCAALYLANDRAGTLESYAEYGRPAALAGRYTRLALARPNVLTNVVRSGQPYVFRVDGAEVALSASAHSALEAAGIGSGAVVPIPAPGRVAGVMLMCYRQGAGPLESDLPFLGSVCAVVGAIVDGLQARQAAAERARRAEAMAEIAMGLSRGASIEEVCGPALRQAVAALHADDGAIWLLAPDGTMLQCVVEARPVPARSGAVVNMRRFPSILAAAKEKRPRFVARTTAPASERAWFDALRYAGAIYAPLHARDHFLGICFLNYCSPDFQPGTDDLDFAAAIAAQCAVAIDHTRLQIEAETERNRLLRMLDQMLEAVMIVDADTKKVVLANRAARALASSLGNWDESLELLPMRLLDSVSEAPLPRDEWPLWRALQGETVAATKYIMELPEGTRWYILASAVPLRDSSGRVREGLLVAQDVSELHRLDRERDQLVAVISHELRNPLASVVGYAQLLRQRLRSGDTREQRYLVTLEAQARRMAALIEGLTSVSQLAGEAARPVFQPVDLSLLCRRVAEQVQVTTSEHQIRLEVPDTLICTCDAGRIEQVLANLLNNAVKYSPGGGEITLTLHQRDAHARLAVRDRGIGIPREVQERLFERFYRGPNVTTITSGLGLGLYICAQIVALHHGRIWVESELGQGSTFYVELPLARPEP
jgi:two-component system phosphate regulon sensor histidine kinase PhoR